MLRRHFTAATRDLERAEAVLAEMTGSGHEGAIQAATRILDGRRRFRERLAASISTAEGSG